MAGTKDDGSRSARAPGSEELLQLVIDSATDFAILSTDPTGQVTSWNPGAERLLGYGEDEIMGRSADAIFTPEDSAAGVPEAERRQALALGRALDERWTMRRDGSRFRASGLMMPLADRSHGFVKIFRDRTAQHRAEARVHESEERFRLLATSIPQLVFRTRADGQRTWGCPQWIGFTGLSQEESLGLGWLEAIHPEDREMTQQAWPEAQRSGEYYVEHRIRRAADGRYRWHQTRACRVDGGEDPDWVGTMTDIHGLSGLQDRQQVLVAELQHRTRNLLAVVQAIARQTLRTGSSLEVFGLEFEARLQALGRVQSLLARFDHRNIDLRELVADEIAAIQGPERERVRLDGPPVTLPAAEAQALGLALHELATNAVKHGALSQPDGRLAMGWREEPAAHGRQITVEWSESGVAMPAGRPAHHGYGLTLLERALPYQLGAATELEFGAGGIRCTITVLLDDGAKDRDG